MEYLLDNALEHWPWLAGALLVVAALSAVIKRLVGLVRNVKELGGELQGLGQRYRAYRLNLVKRRRFCRYLALKVREVNNLEQWLDDRYTVISASIENQSHRSLLGGRRPTARRERSLARALKRSQDPLIVLEGEPGAGKSVTLRHLALKLLTASESASLASSPVPLYVNLKDFKTSSGEPVTHIEIKQFVLRHLTAGSTLHEETFLAEQFETGLARGWWLFLFDSFDELPEVLAGYEYDEKVQEYSAALANFLTRPGSDCRGIIASRYFRGPKQTLWTRFKVLPLNRSQQRTLIRRAALPYVAARKLFQKIRALPAGAANVATNPMFLGLMCEFARTSSEVELELHELFEGHVRRQLELGKDAGLDPDRAKEAAELFGFVMAKEQGLGLSPNRSDLIAAAFAESPNLNIDMEDALDDLERVRLMRYDPQDSRATRATTFVHRRFQEYFAAEYLLSNSHSTVSARELLTLGQWREPAVTLLQTQSVTDNASLIEEASLVLLEVCHQMPDPDARVELSIDLGARTKPGLQIPNLAFHVLSVIDSGFSRRIGGPPGRLQQIASLVLWHAAAYGQLGDRIASVELCGVSSTDVKSWLIAKSFQDSSNRTRDAAFWVAHRLGRLPPQVAAAIIKTLLEAAAAGLVWRERYTLVAQASRLDPRLRWVHLVRLLVAIPLVDIVLYGVLAILGLHSSILVGLDPVYAIPVVVLAYVGSVAAPDVIANFLRSNSSLEVRSLSGLDESGRTRAIFRRSALGQLTILSMVACSRIFWILAVVSLASARSDNASFQPNASLLLLIGSLYLGMWSPSVYLLVGRGRNPRMLTILLAPLAAVVFAVVGVLRLAVRKPLLLIQSLAIGALGLAVYVLLGLLLFAMWSVARPIAVLLIIFLIVSICLGLLRLSLHWLRRKQLLKQWKVELDKLKGEPMPAQVIQTWLYRLEGAEAFREFFYILRTTATVALSETALTFLRQLSEFADQASRNAAAELKDATPLSRLVLGLSSRRQATLRKGRSQRLLRLVNATPEAQRAAFYEWASTDWGRAFSVVEHLDIDEVSYVLSRGI